MREKCQRGGDWTPLATMYILFIIRTKALILAKKLRTSKENKASLALTQNIKTKCLGYPFLKLKEQKSGVWISIKLSLTACM